MLTFRLFGHFNWPPTYRQPSAPVPGSTQAGVIEIHFIPDRAGTRALLRWCPGTISPPDLDPAAAADASIPNVFTVTAPAQLFGSAAEQLAWIASSGSSGGKLAFRGAFWLEQFVRDSHISKLELAWPLVRSCRYRTDEPEYFSSLIIGQDRTDEFRFDLQLPVPVPQTSLRQGGELNPPVLPFSVLYASHTGPIDTNDPNQAKALTRLKSLVPGTSGRGQLTFEETANFDVQDLNRRLGAFGFTANAGVSNFAGYEGNYAYNATQAIDVRDFWPGIDAAEDVLDQAFAQFGFDVTPRPFRGVKLSADDARQLSVRFETSPPKPAAGQGVERQGRLIYRLTLVPNGAGNAADVEGDFAATSTGFALRLKDELDGWLWMASDELQVELELSWPLERPNPWSSEWTPRLSLRLLWDENIVATFKRAQTPALSGRVYRAGTLADAADAAIALHSALRWSEGSQPQSLLPSLEPDPSSQPVRFMLRSVPSDIGVDNNGRLRLWPPRSLRRRRLMRLTLADSHHLIAGEAAPSFKGFASFPSFFWSGASAASPRLPVTLSCDHLPDDPDLAAIPVFSSFRLAWDATRQPTQSLPWRGRLSSLEFSGPKAWSTAVTALGDLEGWLRVGGPGTRAASRSLGARVVDRATVAVSVNVFLAVDAIVPLGVDVVRGDRTGRSAALLVPLNGDPNQGDTTAAAPVSFILSAIESMASTEDRLLTATILEKSDATGSQDYVLLGSEPFSVMRFAEVRLGARGDADNAAVASYSSDSRIWQLKQVTPYYHYVLPPQAVGEGTDKPRRLELFDLETPEAPDEGPFRPYDDEPLPPALSDDELAQWGDLHRRAVAFKLTPSAEVWLRPSDVERRYFMPAWDTYDLFRQRGALGLGAAVAALRAEFLYGLSVGVDTSRETGAAGQARLAEIEALTGRPVGPATSLRPGDEDFGIRWNALADVIMKRPERLEVWAADQKSSVDFAPARFTDGVYFALRGTALSRAPVLDPFGSDEAAGLLKLPSGPRLRLHPQGLDGGAFWPIESPNLLKSLQGRPDSTGGSLQGVAFSPLGGDAQQKAEFLNGKVAILSETRNGFVERQKVEVLGRIGALWHRAKHVVVYQRTTNPTAQFAPKKKEDPTHRRSRRPILRKVSEYIELLEPERSYPDFAEGTARSAGYLKRVRFNSKIINVDGAWACDIESDAYELPLWDRLAARERPQVYPLPDIAFVSIAEGEGDDALVAQECQDPQKLFFFADISSATSSDTNTWPARVGIDFSNVPPSSKLADIVDARSPLDPQDGGRRKNVTRQLPGASRFAWRLAPATRKSAINAGRSNKPVYVALDTVSFMRGTQTAAPFPDELEAILEVRRQPTAAVDGLTYWPPVEHQGGSRAPPVLAAAAFTTAVTAFKSSLSPNGPVDAHKVTAIETALANLKGPLSELLKGPATKAAEVASTFSRAQTLLSSAPSTCETLKSNALGLIKGKAALVLENLRAWENQAEVVLNTPLAKKKDLRAKLLADIDRLLRPIFDEATADVGRGASAVEAARAIITDTLAEAEAVIARARARVKASLDAYDRDMPSSPSRRAALQATLVAAVSSVNDDIEAAVDEARQRLGVELGNAAQALAGHLAIALEGLTATQAIVLTDLQTVAGGAYLLRPIETVVASLLNGGLDDSKKAVAAARKAVSLDPATPPQTKTRVLAALERADGLLEGVRAEAQHVHDDIDTVKRATAETADKVAAGIGDVATRLATVIADLDSFRGDAETLLETGWIDAGEVVAKCQDFAKATTDAANQWLGRNLQDLSDTVDLITTAIADAIDALAAAIEANIQTAGDTLGILADDLNGALAGLQAAVAPGALFDQVLLAKVVGPALDAALAAFPDDLLADNRPALVAALSSLDVAVASRIDALTSDALNTVDNLANVCAALAEDATGVIAYFDKLKSGAAAYIDQEFNSRLDDFKKQCGLYGSALSDTPKLLAAANALDYTIRGLNNDLVRSAQTARMLGDRVMDAVGKIDIGKPLSVPSTILKAYAAVTSAPEIAALKADADRIRASFDELSDIVKTTRTTALFNHLGDELKALGLSLPFDGIGDRILPVDLSSFDISAVFRRFGGLNLDRLFKDLKLPQGAGDAIRVTHDFDKAKAFAWVQVDIALPMPGRRTLFSLEVFAADFVDMHLTGRVRLEASKDKDSVTQTGFGRIETDLQMLVGGQLMVTFEQLGLNFTREAGLKVDFDPTRIRLNPSFQFIQDLLSDIFPDDLGGLKIVKQDGLPVGVEHEFTLPPISLMFGTSGVSNISISNRFKLLAFPDFVIADRFSLSRPELPFLFSIFIIGGTGYIEVEAEYRPFAGAAGELTVGVEAAAGGSATLGLAFGPFSGSVFIALSIAISYHKLIGKPGGGLTIGMVLVISGNVTVLGLVTVNIYLLLRVGYADNGEVNADGTLSVSISISRFFKITARAEVYYKLRGGRSETVTRGDVSAQASQQIQTAAKALNRARG